MSFAARSSLALVLLFALGLAPAARAQDYDRDGRADSADNCAAVANPGQEDRGGFASYAANGVGDACECGDVNGDGAAQLNDATLIRRRFAGMGPGLARPELCNVSGELDARDADGDGLRDDCTLADLVVLRRAFLGKPPGRGTACGNVVPADQTAPAVELIAPAQATAGQPFAVRALATDETGVTQLELRADGVALGTVGQGELFADVTAPALPGATIELRAEARDAAGNRGEASASVAVVALADTTPPSVSLVAPASGAPGARVTLAAIADDDRGVREVRFLLEGQLVASTFAPPYRVELSIPADAAPSSRLALAVEALDAEGNVGRAQAELLVVAAADTAPPTGVAVSAPARAVAGQTVTATATASDDVGILEIEFFVDAVQVGADAVPPYQASYAVPAGAAPGTRLLWSARAVDFASNAATSPEVETLVAARGRALVVGEVYDDTRSQPLAGASVEVLGSAAAATTDARGRFALELDEGPARLRLSRAGWSEAQRQLDVPAAGVVSPLDARLTPRGPGAPATPDAPIRLASADGSVELELPAGALAAAVELRVTPLSEQGLPAPLPPGWSPLVAAEIAPTNGTLALPGVLRFADAGPGVAAVAVRFDAASGSWRVAAESAGAVELPALGTYALALSDAYGPAPLPTPGAALAASSPAAVPSGARATFLPSPEVIFLAADARSDVEVALESASPLPSGTPLPVRFAESYDRLDGSAVATEPATQDFLLYRRAAGLRAAFAVTPSDVIDAASLREGVIALDALAAELAARAALGAAGGTVATGDGLAVEVPAGALAGASSVSLARSLSSDLPADPRLRFVGGAALDLGGARPSLPLSLRLTPAAPPAAGETVLVVRRVRVLDDTRLEWVAIAALEGSELVARAGPAGLPLPGIDAEGAYTFVAVGAPVAFLTGALASEGDGAPASALAETSSLPFVSLAEAADPRYALVAALGPAALRGLDLDSGARAAADVALAAPGEIASADLVLRAFRPSVVSVDPADGAAGVAPGAPVTVRFDAPMDRASAEGGAGLSVASGPLAAVAALSADGLVLTLRAAGPLPGETLHTLRLAATSRDRFGNALLGNRPDGSFETSFTSADTTPPARPAAGQIAYEPVGEGTVRVSGSLGAAEPGTTVSLQNRTTGVIRSVLVGADGSFSLELAASFLDPVDLRLRDAAGNETVEEMGRVRPPEGVGVVGAAGGVVTGAAGLAATIPPAVLPQDAVVRVEPLDVAAFPPLPFPAEDQVQAIAAARFAMGEVVVPDVRSMRLEVEDHPDLAIQDDVPLFEIEGPFELPASAAPGSVLRLRVTGRDTTGHVETLEVELPIVAAAPDATPRRVATQTSPVVSLVLPTQATPGQTISLTAKVEPPDLKIRFAAPPEATSGAQFFVWELVRVGNREIYSLIDEAELRTLPDGARVLETRSPPYRGIRRTLDRLVLSMSQEPNLSLVRTLIRTTAAAGSGIAGVAGPLGSNPTEALLVVGAQILRAAALAELQDLGPYEFNVIPVRAGSPAQISAVDFETNTLLAQAQAAALAPRAFSEVIVLGEDDNDPLATGINSFKNDAVPLDAAFSVSFSHPMDVSTLTSQSVVLECAGTRIPARLVYTDFPVATGSGTKPGATILKVAPTRALPAATACLLRITAAAKRVGGRALDPLIMAFKTAGPSGVVARVAIPGATAFDVHEKLMLVAANPPQQNAVHRILLDDASNPTRAGSVSFDPVHDGAVRDVAIVPDFALTPGSSVPLAGVTLGGLDVFSSVRLFRADQPALPRVGGALVGTPSSELLGLGEVIPLPDVNPFGTGSNVEFFTPEDGLVPGVPATPTTPGAIDYEGNGSLYFVNLGVGVMTLDVARAVPPPPVSERGSQLGPSFLPADKTGLVVVKKDPSFVQDNGSIRFTNPAADPEFALAGSFSVSGAISDPAVRRVVVNTVAATITAGPGGGRTFQVALRPRAGITELVATAFDESGEAIGEPLRARLVSLFSPNPLQGPGTVDIAGNPGFLIGTGSSLAVSVSVSDTTRLDAIFVNGVAAGAKVCPIGVDRRNRSCGWNGAGSATVATPGPVTAIVATAIDIDEEFPQAPGYVDIDQTEGLVAAVSGGSGFMDLFDASGLVRIAQVDLETPFRVRMSKGVFVDLDGDGRLGDAENDDGDVTTSWDELRTLAIAGEGSAREISIVDVTEPGAAQLLGVIPTPRKVYRAWAVPEEGIAYVAADTHVMTLDLAHSSGLGLVDRNGDGIDDRILGEVAVPDGGVQDVIADPARALVFAMQEEIGVAVLGASCDTDVAPDVTRRSVLPERPFNSVANLRADLLFALQRGFGDPACGGYAPNQNVAVFAQGSSACIWRSDGRCSSAYQRSISDYDFELIVDGQNANAAVPCGVAIEHSIRNEDALGIPLPQPLPNGSVFPDVSVFVNPRADLTDAFRDSQPNPVSGSCGAGDDEIGDACLGRNGLMLKWYLEGEFVHGAFGGQSMVMNHGLDFDALIGALARPITPDEPASHLGPGSQLVEPSHIPLHEGGEWGCLQQLQLERSGARYRVRGAGLGPAAVHWPFWTSELHKVGKAGIRAVYGRLLANRATNRRVVTVSRKSYESPFGCYTDFDFTNLQSGPDETLTNLDTDFRWKRCESFEEYVASQALLSVRDGLGVLSKADAIRAYEMFRVKSDVGPPIDEETEANEFVVEAMDLVERIRTDAEVVAHHQTRSEYSDGATRTINFNVCGNAIADARTAPFKVPLRVANQGYGSVFGLDVRAFQNGNPTEQVSLALGAGEDRFFPKASFQFPRGLQAVHQVQFVADPENAITEYDKENNFDGLTFYYLDPALPLAGAGGASLAATPPSAPIRPPLPGSVQLELPATAQCRAPSGGKVDSPAADLTVTVARPQVSSPIPPGDDILSGAAGETVELHFTVRNLGNVTLANAVIRTTLSAASGCQTLSLPNVPAGQTRTVTCTVQIPGVTSLVLAVLHGTDPAGNLAAVTSTALELQPVEASVPALEPLIFVPGMAGSELFVNGNNRWPDGSSSAKREELTLSPAEPHFQVEARDAFRQLSFGPITKKIYAPLLDELVGAATQVSSNVPGAGPLRRYKEYAHQNPANRTSAGCQLPAAGAVKPTLFVFPWDWRRSLTETTPLLHDYVQCIRKIHGSDVPIHMLVHSMGGLVGRRYVLDHPGEITRFISLGTPYLGAPKDIYVMQTGDFIGSIAQGLVLIGKKKLRELGEFFPGVHELLPTRQYFEMVQPLGSPLLPTPLRTGRLAPPTPLQDADHLRFRVAFDGVLFPASQPVRRSIDTFVPEMGDWRRDATRARYHHVYGSAEDTVLRVSIRGNVLHQGLISAAGAAVVEEAVSLAADTVAAAIGAPPIASALIGAGINYLLPSQWVSTDARGYGDGTVPSHSSARIRPVAGNSGGPLNLNAPGAELKRVAQGERLHNEMVGNPELLRYVFSILQPDLVQVPQSERGSVCPTAAPTPGCLPELVQ